MRPLRLTLEGIGSFRDVTDVSFDQVDLFAVVGPTGSGKTTLIEAMVFALYGAVPRHGPSTVAPVLSIDRNVGKVRFDFAVGSEIYTAVRVLSRAKNGQVTTKEARLETAGGAVVAGDAAGVTAEVRRLLGLGFSEFCRTVLLPQGQFAQFLHGTPGERQDLLVDLLGLAAFRTYGEQARARARDLETRVAADQRLLEALAHATDDAVAATAGRVTELAGLAGQVDGWQTELDGLVAAGQAAREQLNQATAVAAAAEQATVVPPVVTSAAAAIQAASQDVADAQAAYESATQAAADAADGVPDGPDDATLDRLVQTIGQIDVLTGSVAAATAERDVAERDLLTADDTVKTLRRSIVQVRGELDTVRFAEAAATLRATLTVGDPCPVCDHTVGTVPEPAEGTGGHEATLVGQLTDLEQRHEQAVDETDGARKALDTWERKLSADQATLAALTEQATGVASALWDVTGGLPDPDTVVGWQQTRQAARDAAAVAARLVVHAQTELDNTQGRLRKAQQTIAAEWDTYHRLRDTLAVAGPPPPVADDLPGSWQTLAAWAEQTLPELQTTVAAAQVKITEASQAWKVRSDEIVTEVRARQVDVADVRQVAAAVAGAVATAEAHHGRLVTEHESRAELEAGIAGQVADQQRWQQLGDLLKTNRFERWVLDRAVRTLAQTASSILDGLTGGTYLLDVDDRGRFEVIDLAAAGIRRPARTLSGGETFLVSLALALALAEQVMAAAGSACQLDTLLIDEGFGTLDPATLDQVAAVIDDLGTSTGRTIGLITHVGSLADRLPVRFRVSRTPDGSSVVCDTGETDPTVGEVA